MGANDKVGYRDNSRDILLSLSWIKYFTFIIFPYLIFTFIIFNSIEYKIYNWMLVANNAIIYKSPYLIWFAFSIYSLYIIFSFIRYTRSKGTIIEMVGDSVILFGISRILVSDFNQKILIYENSLGGHFFVKLKNRYIRVPKLLVREQINIEQIFEKIHPKS